VNALPDIDPVPAAATAIALACAPNGEQKRGLIPGTGAQEALVVASE